MKKAILAAAIAARLISAGVLYPAAFVVTDVQEQPDGGAVLTMESRDGHIWTAEGDGDTEPGEILAAVMFDGFTPDDKTDDRILDLRWSGFAEEVF